MSKEELTQGELIQIACKIYEAELALLKECDFDFLIAILRAINYRRNKIRWKEAIKAEDKAS